MPTRIVQLTDLHLFADPHERLHGIPTRASFRDVLELVFSDNLGFDGMVITGDLSHDERRETYEAIRELLGSRLDVCRIIPGNHDDRRLIREVFPELVSAGDGPLTFSTAIGCWQLIGLDSHDPGEVSGRIDSEQLRWLGEELASHSEEPTILFIHHPPVSVEVAWLDNIGLQEPEGLRELVTNSPQVKIVSAGHVHHEFAGRLGHAVVYTTPSTGVQIVPAGVQFVPAGDGPVYDPVPPGYRLFVLDDGEFQTEIVRLPQVKYPPVGES